MKHLLLIVFLSIFQLAFAQQDSSLFINGRLTDVFMNEPIPFVTVYNKTLHQGTITAEDGYFRLRISSAKDSVIVSAIGYKPLVVKLFQNQEYYSVEMEANATNLDEVVVLPADETPLFEVLQKCLKHKSIRETGKSYYMLRSFREEKQVELVEGYYNINVNGYDVEDLELKAGRLALQTYEDRYFTSQAGSDAIVQLKTFEENRYFPQTPLNVKLKEAQKLFRLEIQSRYCNEKNDSVYVIHYRPKLKAPQNFEGTIWVNVSRNVIEKLTMNCTDCQNYPFSPIFPTDSIRKVDLNITRTFVVTEGHQTFNHIDFSYRVDYVSRPGKPERSEYSVQTNAVLYAYDYAEEFDLPKFQFVANTQDYRKLNAFPYNPFFWDNRTEFDMNDADNRNDAFFKDPQSITNVRFFKSQRTETPPEDKNVKTMGYLEHPYIHWSKNRVFLREIVPDSIEKAVLGTEKSRLYHLEVQLFVDFNAYSDSTNILTETIFDPYLTYYYLPIDANTNCFINMYFDLCEVHRRRLEEAFSLRVNPSREEIQVVYDQFMKSSEEEKTIFLKEVDRGTNLKAMSKWNEYIMETVRIDNMKLFQLEAEKN